MTDIAIPLDGKLTLTADPHPYRVPKPPPKPLAPRKAALEAQARRHRALMAEGNIVKVGMGATVFREGFSGSHLKVWDGHHEATTKPRPKKLIPGEGFAD
jgi:hypothetical protein